MEIVAYFCVNAVDAFAGAEVPAARSRRSYRRAPRGSCATARPAEASTGDRCV